MNPREFRLRFGARMRELRRRRKESPEAFAAALGVSLTTMLRWSSGLYMPRIDGFARICQRLEVEPLALLGAESELDG